MVLWAIVVLTALMFTFSFMTRTDALSTFSYREAITRDYLAEAGISRAVMEIIFFNQMRDELLTDYDTLWKPDGAVYEGEMTTGKYQVRISDEYGKININSEQSDRLLRTLLMNFEVEEEQIETIVDSIKDWRDPDDLHRINGVESEYYETLTPPYKAKNANFDTIEELMWVKGVTTELFYGTEDGKALKDYITIYGEEDGTIRLFTASREVLMAIDGMTEAMADGIIEQRSEGLDITVDGLSEVGESYVDEDSDLSEGIYTIEALGTTSNKPPDYGVKAIVHIDDEEYMYINWRFRSPVSVKAALAEAEKSDDIENKDKDENKDKKDSL
jgi:general secretion pathway protein K